jgi:TRAP-type C4-dicarboxylate transport system permease small subunit
LISMNSMIKKMTQGQSAVEHWLTIIAAGIIMVMVFLTAIDVILRYIFNSPLPGAYELKEFLLVGVVFLGLGYIQSIKGHLSVDVLISRMSPKTQTVFNILSYVICLFTFSIITWQAGYRAWIAFDTGQLREGLVRYPLWPAKLMIPIGTGLLCLRLIRDIIVDFDKLRKKFYNLPGGR